ncbi:MAG: cytochrome c [Rhodospirillales bacterium]|nr:cytochrome c [Rhodospirillales bacterium]
MRSTVVTTAFLAALSLAAVAGGAFAADSGQAAFAKRKHAMDEMGHALFLQIGKVAKGQLHYGPDTVQAAQTLNNVAQTIATLFPPGSAVKGSRMNPDIVKDPQKIEALAMQTQATTAALLVAVKTGDLSKIGAATQTADKACAACHTQYRLKTKL